ncbi:hypothetical protein Pcinc_016885 [Petrolisthes cinctipes]|uniref:Rho-GAP domain-containing protein n=1 Tax=Petrolisthes cinctipes TaxID=88211 RepID=A0AAE1FRU6_PETCI|nr:hypothetical protein Pcinc_016885 [Petrolisthes cinctipes]
MEDEQEELKDVVMEELTRLGVISVQQQNGSAKTKVFHNGPNKFTTSNNNNPSSSSSKSTKNKTSKIRKSPRISASTKSPTYKSQNERKNTPKSPFGSSKWRAEHRKQQLHKDNKAKVFGRGLCEQATTVVRLPESLEVTVPEFLVDVCSLIRRSVTTKGIFRKAGSAQRQADIKRLVDGGASLPASVHVIDAACLLKQFLRCFPDPLLPFDVHTKMARCLHLPLEEDRIEAMVLCTLLLPRPHRHTLIYLMDFFSSVIAASESNLMGAGNLAIVLAPNLLPSTLSPPTSRRKSTGQTASSAHETTLTTNIKIMELLLECCDVVCRLSSSVTEALELRLRTRSTENLLAASNPPEQQQQQLPPQARKKRRSASIQRIMTGLRRLVDHSRGDGSSSHSPLQPASSTEDLDVSLRLHPGVTLSPVPVTPVTSPRKRKSADAFDLGLEFTREQGRVIIPTLASSPSCKRAKLDIEVGKTKCFSATANAVIPASLLPPLCASSSRTKEKGSRIGGSPGVGGQDVLRMLTPGCSSILGHTSPYISRGSVSNSSQGHASPLQAQGSIPDIPHHSPLSRGASRTNSLLGGYSDVPRFTRTLTKTRSQVTTPVSPPPRLVPKRRSCELPLGLGVKRSGSFQNDGRVAKRCSIGRRMTQNEPDGAELCTLEPRGVPDGAECNLRDATPIVSSQGTSIEALEQQYDSIKQVVQSMEEEIGKKEMQQLQDTYFPDTSISATAQNMSCSDMIQTAYERMKVETRELGSSPSDNLSRRLGKELKIRNRRSGEHRVIRSPSERRIGTIRRRSRELVQNIAKNSIHLEDTPGPPPQTPKLKPTLLQTPTITSSLRRGKPNSVKSGLPMVVRTESLESPTQLDDTCRHVLINKRSSQKKEQSTGKKFTRYSLDESSSGKISRENSIDQPSNTSNMSDMDCVDVGLSGSFLDQMPGPLTRRRSSLLSLSSRIPHLTLSPSTPATPTSSNKRKSRKESKPHRFFNMECEMDRDFESHLSESLEMVCNDVSGAVDGSEENWVPASDFKEYLEVCESGVCSENMGRPSLAALMKQQKVKANVQLFNNLHSTTPQRRQSRARCITPQSRPSISSAMLEQCSGSARRTPSSSIARHRGTLTPRELLRARQKSFQVHSSRRRQEPKVAVVSPLRESTWPNVQQEHSHYTPRPYHGHATAPRPPHTPVHPSFFLPAKPRHIDEPFCSTSSSSPPKLPPRGAVRPSPIRIQYR